MQHQRRRGTVACQSPRRLAKQTGSRRSAKGPVTIHVKKWLPTWTKANPCSSRKMPDIQVSVYTEFWLIADMTAITHFFAGEPRKKLLSSLSSHDYFTLRQSRDRRHPETADWLFQTREFNRWITNHQCQTTWCSGKCSCSFSLTPILLLTVSSWLRKDHSCVSEHPASFARVVTDMIPVVAQSTTY